MKVAISITNSIIRALYVKRVCVCVCVDLMRTCGRKRVKKEKSEEEKREYTEQQHQKKNS